MNSYVRRMITTKNSFGLIGLIAILLGILQHFVYTTKR